MRTPVRARAQGRPLSKDALPQRRVTTMMQPTQMMILAFSLETPAMMGMPAPVGMRLVMIASVRAKTLSSVVQIQQLATTTQMLRNRTVHVPTPAMPAMTDLTIPLTTNTKVTARAVAPWFQLDQRAWRWKSTQHRNTGRRTAFTRRLTHLPMSLSRFTEQLVKRRMHR